MRLLILGHYPVKKYNGRYYIKRLKGMTFLEPHFAGFDSLTVCFRVTDVKEEPEDWELIDDPRIDFVDFHSRSGLRSHLGLLGSKTKKLVFDAVKRADCVSSWGFVYDMQIVKYCNRHGKPYLRELVVDSAEAIREYSPKFKWALRLLALRAGRRLRGVLKRSDAAIYVDKLSLPAAYPTSPGKLSVSCSDVGLKDELLASPRVYDKPVDVLKIAFAAAFWPRKRHCDIIDACSTLKKEGKKIELRFMGNGPNMEEMKAYAQEKGLEIGKDVIFYGFIADPDRLFKLIDGCDVGVLCSTTEGLSRALVEEMARGLGAIATEVGGNPELVRPQELYKVGDVAALTGILREAIDDPKRLTEMSKHAAETASEFTNSKLLKIRRDTYRKFAELAKK